jgi:hypothetical protein
MQMVAALARQVPHVRGMRIWLNIGRFGRDLRIVAMTSRTGSRLRRLARRTLGVAPRTANPGRAVLVDQQSARRIWLTRRLRQRLQ